MEQKNNSGKTITKVFSILLLIQGGQFVITSLMQLMAIVLFFITKKFDITSPSINSLSTGAYFILIIIGTLMIIGAVGMLRKKAGFHILSLISLGLMLAFYIIRIIETVLPVNLLTNEIASYSNNKLVFIIISLSILIFQIGFGITSGIFLLQKSVFSHFRKADLSS